MIAILDEFLQTHAENLIQDPVKRAVCKGTSGRCLTGLLGGNRNDPPIRPMNGRSDLQIRSPHKGSSRAELPQVMIQMLVHSATPVLRRKGAKKRMRMPGAVPFSTLVELAHLHLKLFLFSKKFPLI